MVSFLIRVAGNTLAIYVSSVFLTGFVVAGNIKEFAIAGALLAVLNTTVRPFLKLISMPLIILTLGIFTIVINALMLWVVDYFLDFVIIESTSTLILATFIVSVINIITTKISNQD